MSSNFNEDAAKNPGELEHEADEQRASIEQTLTELAQRFVPSEMIEQVLDFTRGGGGGDLSRTVMNSVRANPVPALLTATGLAWMMFGQNRPKRHSESGYLPEDDIPARASYGVDPDYDPRLRGRSDGEKAGQQASAGFQKLLRDQPLAIGVIGLAFGAIVAASLPRSRQEDELLGDTKERMADKASQLSGRARAKVDKVGRHIAERAEETPSSDPSKTHH